MPANRATAVVEQLMEDEYLHEQLAVGGARVRAAYHRARAMRSHEAVQDKKLYDHVRGAAAALTEAARRLAGKPTPEPPRRSRRLSVALVAVAVVVLVRQMHRIQQAKGTASPGS
jgi:hypothetical protein